LCSLDTLLCIIIINILLLEYIILYWKTCWLPELILYRNIVSFSYEIDLILWKLERTIKGLEIEIITITILMQWNNIFI